MDMDMDMNVSMSMAAYRFGRSDIVSGVLVFGLRGTGVDLARSWNWGCEGHYIFYELSGHVLGIWIWIWICSIGITTSSMRCDST